MAGFGTKLQKVMKKIRSWMRSNIFVESVSEKPFEDFREFDRFDLSLHSAVGVIGLNGDYFPVVNLSYGGFGSSVRGAYENEFSAELLYLNHKVKTSVAKVFDGPKVSGYRFIHKDSGLLVFLRQILEHVRYGASLYEVDKLFLKEKYVDKSWVYMRGEGQTELIYHCMDASNVNYILFKVKFRGDVFRLKREEGVYQVSKDGLNYTDLDGYDLAYQRELYRYIFELVLGLRDQKHVSCLSSLVDQLELKLNFQIS